MSEMYRQCLFEQGKKKTTAWVPENFKGVAIKPGVNVILLGLGQWTVISVGNVRMAHDHIIARSRDWARHRDATDI